MPGPALGGPQLADRLKNGDVFVLYVSIYSVGRFFVETLRIDPAFIIGTSFRGNLLVSGILALGFALVLVLRHSRTYQTLQNRADEDVFGRLRH